MTNDDDTLTRRYLTGSLTEEERAMFEERILSDPALQKEIELTHAMREGIRELARRGELPALVSAERSFWNRPIFGIAASIAAMAFATTSILLYTRDDNSAGDVEALASLAPAAAREVLHFELTRGGSSTPDVTWRRSSIPTVLALQFDVGLEPAPNYSVALDWVGANSTSRIVAIPHLAPSPDGLITFEMHSSLLPTGDYHVVLEGHIGDAPTGQRLTYSMRVSCAEQRTTPCRSN